MTSEAPKRYGEMEPEDRRELERLALEPRTKQLDCAGCGEPLRRLFPDRATRAWCMYCSMQAMGWTDDDL